MNITIIGRRWFNGAKGSTYHSVTVYVEGELVGCTPYAYGYDNAYEQTAWEILETKRPDITQEKRGFWEIRENHNIVSEASNVARKKDL